MYTKCATASLHDPPMGKQRAANMEECAKHNQHEWASPSNIYVKAAQMATPQPRRPMGK